MSYHSVELLPFTNVDDEQLIIQSQIYLIIFTSNRKKKVIYISRPKSIFICGSNK